MGGGRASVSRGAAGAESYLAEAGDVLRFVEALPDLVGEGERTVIEKAAALLQAFEKRLLASGAPQSAAAPARYALAVLIDQAVRRQKAVRMSAWSAAAHARLFDGRDMSVERIRKFRDTARNAGGDYAPLEMFLAGIIERLEGARRSRPRSSARPTVLVLGGVVALIVALVLYAVFLDYRYHARTFSAFAAEVRAIEAGEDGLAERLDRLAAAVERVENASELAPLSGLPALPYASSAARARAVLSDRVNAGLPRAVAELIEREFATEGESLPLYDTLRVWSVLAGETEWSAGYVGGWLADRSEGEALARYAGLLTGPDRSLPPPDAELVRQARDFAADLSEPERAWLELKRSDGARALEPWSSDRAVPGLREVVVRRSGRPLDAGMVGLFTERGWEYARQIGAGTAVQRARDVAPVVLGISPDRRNDSPDILLERLQRETVERWKSWLSDLRVRPFSERDTALLISGSLAQRNSPLDALIREVWRQVGGEDRSRPHEAQVGIIAPAFGAMIQYAEQGRLSEISSLFAALNVALSTIDFDEDRGAERLMSVQDRSRSIRALAAAPPIVAQITEDVLAQTSAAHSSLLSNPLTRQWQRDVYPLCHATVNESYPFNGGPDASLEDFDRLFSPDGLIRRFVASAARYIDTSGEVWRWKPEARLTGLSPETAEFLQKAAAISEAFFSGTGTLTTEVRLAALAERGEAMVFIGGDGVPVRADASTKTLSWPGPDPAQGAEVAFREGAATERVIGDGPWGLYRILDGTRLRIRDGGERVLVDLRTEAGRLFLEMGFSDPLNPVAARSLVSGLVCPPVL